MADKKDLQPETALSQPLVLADSHCHIDMPQKLQ
jgi:hypothetical protein